MDGFFEFGLPTLIALAFVNFVWAWMLTAVKPPERSEDEPIPVHPDWKYLEEAGPEGVRSNVTEEMKPQTQVVG
ncbi:MAG: hypothetical protein EPO39_00615 [Candidatus Manganitrophaceae bacterium]|nr:MAG: hypothetical protein EPO39_00615 [Candidatus Manganitrophaceae bacterium]